MSLWRVKQNERILWRVDATNEFIEIDPESETVSTVFASTQSSLDFEAYDISYAVQGKRLRQCQTTTKFGQSPRVTWSTQRELTPLSGDERDVWMEWAPFIYQAYLEGRQLDGQVLRRSDQRRAASFVAALPEDCSDLEFRKVAEGWAVSVRGQSAFWIDSTYRYRGKDLFFQLREVLSGLGRLESFVPRMEDDVQALCFHGE